MRRQRPTRAMDEFQAQIARERKEARQERKRIMAKPGAKLWILFLTTSSEHVIKPVFSTKEPTLKQQLDLLGWEEPPDEENDWLNLAGPFEVPAGVKPGTIHAGRGWSI